MTQEDFRAQFPTMTPIKRMPSLVRFNGCGTTILGKRDVHPQNGAYITTLCFTFLFLPLFFIRAYRVAHADRGWYFLGREPLSILAKTYNFAIVLALAATVSGVTWELYASTPAYKAHRQMVEARSLADQGHLAQAARIYQQLATAGADEATNATQALKELAQDTSRYAHLAEYAGVLEAAARITSRSDALTLPQIVAQGLQLVTEKGESDSRGALAVLDAIRPLAVDTRPIDKARLPLLRKWATEQPANLDAVIPLASLLEQQDQLDEARKLLLPLKDKLGDGEGARALGTILVRDGDYDAAYALLWPYVKIRLDRLHAAEKTCESTLKSLWDREVQLLRDDKGPRQFYEKYDKASKEEQENMVDEYIAPRVRKDPGLIASQDALARETAVVPVTIELGIVMLHRAQAQTDLAARKKQFESAEQVFLAIKGVAGETDEYRLYLGQVYFWLGKQAEGRKLFDELLASKGRSAEALNSIAQRLYDLGAKPETRTLTEEAYGKATKPEIKYAIAALRSLCDKDVDDKILWLNRCDVANPTIKARLAWVLGCKAQTEGRDDEAARQYRAAIDAYNAIPRDTVVLNDTALVYESLFQVSGDQHALDHCVDFMQQAVNLSPADPILMYNAACMVSQASLSEVVGKDLDLHALREVGDFSLLSYLYRDQAGRDAVVQRLKEHPGTARTFGFLEKAMVLSPKHGGAYGLASAYHHFTYNDAALGTLEHRLKDAGIDTADQLSNTREFLSGAKDAKYSADTAADVKRAETLCNSLRPRGDRTAAVAISAYAEKLMELDTFTNSADPDKVLALAQEAQRLAPSAGTDGTLLMAHLFRATKELCRTEPACEALHKKYARSLGPTSFLVAALNEPGPLRQKILQNPDFQKAAAIELEEISLFPANPTLLAWAILRHANPAAADKAAEAIRKNPRKLVEQSIANVLSPASGRGALESSWLFLIHGKTAEARQSLQNIAALGIPVPTQP